MVDELYDSEAIFTVVIFEYPHGCLLVFIHEFLDSYLQSLNLKFVSPGIKSPHSLLSLELDASF